MKKACYAMVLLALGLLLRPAIAAEGDEKKPAPAKPSDPAAEKLWKEVLDAMKAPLPPKEWEGKTPNAEQQTAFRNELGVKAAAAADKAREFYTKFPADPKVEEAKEREKDMLLKAVAYGQTNRLAELQKNPLVTEDEILELKINDLQRRALVKQSEGLEAVIAEFEKGARALIKEYPARGEIWQLMLLIANNAKEDKAKAVLKEILASEAPEEIKQQATASLKKLDAVGLPLELSFTALDGRQVDVQKMKGKVVLVDFWATWCGPCVQELPKVRRVYDSLHEQGFEIVGISFDKSKRDFEKFVQQNEMTWPQYFDGQGWGNKFGIQFNISAIPTMWLVDKKGILRDLNARDDLEGKVKNLLAEK